MDTRTQILGDELKAAVKAKEITYREIANRIGLERDESIRNIARKTVENSKYYFAVCKILKRDPENPRRKLSTENRTCSNDKARSVGQDIRKTLDAGPLDGKEDTVMPPADDPITFMFQELSRLKDRVHEIELTIKDLTLVPRSPGRAPKASPKNLPKKTR